MTRAFAVLAVLATGCGQVLDRNDQAEAPDAGAPFALPDAMFGQQPDAANTNDASLPGPPDATPLPTVMFDVGYINQMRVDNTSGVSGGSMGVVVNTGSDPVDLSTATIVSMVDDHPVAIFEMYVYQADVQLAPGQGGGGLSPLAQDFLIASGIVSEPVVTSQFMLGYKLLNLPDGSYTVNGEAVLQLSGRQITLPMRFMVNSGGSGFGVTFTQAQRLSAN